VWVDGAFHLFFKRKEENAREKKTSHKKLHFQFAALVHGNKTKQNTSSREREKRFFSGCCKRK